MAAISVAMFFASVFGLKMQFHKAAENGFIIW